MSQATYLSGPMTLSRKAKVFNIRFFPAGASDPTTTAVDIKGVTSITRTAAGTWLITMRSHFKRLISAQATIQMAAATDLVPQFGTVSNLGTQTPVTLVLRANAVAVATDIAADANNSISVQLTFEDADS